MLGRLARRQGERVRVLLIGDAVSCANTGQKVPQGHYNLELMLRSVIRRGGEIGVRGTCLDARGVGDIELAEGCRRRSLDQLTDWTRSAGRVLVF